MHCEHQYEVQMESWSRAMVEMLLVFKRRPMPVSIPVCGLSGVLAMRTIIIWPFNTLSYTVSMTYSSSHHQGSHLPSFQPVLHRSSHLVQSNVCLPSFSLTALCASHIQVPNSLLLLTLGVFLLIQLWKSSAHTQHGYSLPNVDRKDLVSDWNCGEG
jgi:hypothetical protein